MHFIADWSYYPMGSFPFIIISQDWGRGLKEGEET